jgi:anthranilate synthase component 1
MKRQNRQAIVFILMLALTFSCFMPEASALEDGSATSAGVTQSEKSLKDVKGHWSEEAVQKALEYGFVKGYEGGTFRPDKPVSRVVVLSQRFKFKNRSKPFDVYRRLRSKNPSPYLFYIDFGDFQIAGSSPESLVSVKSRIVSTNPIAGTRARGNNPAEDMKLMDELLKDEKETAEHVMLVDLGRNDIGKISKFGTVKMDKFMDVELYSHVIHIVSKVSGELKDDLHYLEALKSCLPVGTVSGAPKIRAMEIIDEIENTKRGVYAGAVGYFSLNGNMDTCIAIRTILFKDDKAYVQAGAGIVYDSAAENEYRETLNKAMAMKEVI